MIETIVLREPTDHEWINSFMYLRNLALINGLTEEALIDQSEKVLKPSYRLNIKLEKEMVNIPITAMPLKKQRVGGKKKPVKPYKGAK